MKKEANTASELAMKSVEEYIAAEDWIDRVSVSRQLMPLLDQLQLSSLQEHITNKKAREGDVRHDIAMHREMRGMLLRNMEQVAPIVMKAIKEYYRNEVV